MTPASSFAAPFLLLCAAGPACAGKMPPPLALLQGLHIVQDSVAHGEVDDPSIQARLLDQLQASLQSSAKLDGVTLEWEQAAIGYALSGAPSNMALELLERVEQDSDLKPIAAAVSLYLKGNFQNAAEQFQVIKVTDLPANFAPLVVIAHANATFESSTEKSKELFRLALNLAPGTLIEELSLRRLTQISMETGDKGEFLRVSKLYWRRYHDSPFSENYILDYSDGITRFVQENTSEEIVEISEYADDHKMKNIISLVFTNFLQSGSVDSFKSTFEATRKENIFSTYRNDLYIFECIYKMIETFTRNDKNIAHQKPNKYYKNSTEMIYELMADVIDQTSSLEPQAPNISDEYYENSKSDDIADANKLNIIDTVLKSAKQTINKTTSECDNLK